MKSSLIIIFIAFSSCCDAMTSSPLVLTDYLSNPELARTKAKIDAKTIGYVIDSLSISLSLSLLYYYSLTLHKLFIDSLV